MFCSGRKKKRFISIKDDGFWVYTHGQYQLSNSCPFVISKGQFYCSKYCAHLLYWGWRRNPMRKRLAFT